jgi:hypothetical protein
LQKVIAFSDEAHKKWEFTWQRDLGANKKNEFRDEVLVTEEVQCFAMTRLDTAVVFQHPGTSISQRGSVWQNWRAEWR